MIAIEYTNDGEYELTCNEFQLHDWIVSLAHIDGLQDADGGTWFTKIKLAPKGYADQDNRHIIIDEQTAQELEDAANKLLGHIQNFDALLHDLAGYSC